MENSRRKFVKTLVLSTAALAMAPLLKLEQAFAGAPLAKEDDPLVKALGYVKNVDSLKGKDAPPTHKKGNACKNCQFYADPKAKQSKCQLIQSGEVLATGWCKSYSAIAKK